MGGGGVGCSQLRIVGLETQSMEKEGRGKEGREDSDISAIRRKQAKNRRMG